MKLVPANLVEAEGGHGHEHHHGHGHHGHSHEHEGHGRHGHGLEGAAEEEQEAGHGRHAHGERHHGKHHGAHHPDDKPEHPHDTAQGIEWEDDMVEVNRMTTPANMRWKLVDRETGAENAQIDWTFHVGDQVKLRLVNELDSDHPMPHPFHVHGAGRFVVLARDDVVEPNLVWKDTVLVRTGETVDILLEVTNPGRWMAHCHIAEHHESGMMFSFDAVP
jgi:FtsP/CotA-like multicopper oxidase with cupredoxin domain